MGDRLLAKRALELSMEPFFEALAVEVVALVALELGDFVVVLVVLQTDCALLHDSGTEVNPGIVDVGQSVNEMMMSKTAVL